MAEDELEPLITECPNCRTRFRVTETQLQLANGRVRCGACLTVFHGVDHLLWDGRESLAGDARAEDVLNEVLEELSGPPVPGKKASSRPPAEQPAPEESASEPWVKRSATFFGGREPVDTPEDAGARRINPDAYFDTQTHTDSDSDADTDIDSDTDTGDAELQPAGDHDLESWQRAPFKILEPEPEPEPEPEAAPESEPGYRSGSEPEPEAEPRPEPVEGSAEGSAEGDAVAESDEEDAPAEATGPIPAEVAAKPAVPEAVDVDPVESLDAVLREPISFAPEPRRWWVPIAIAIGVVALLLQVFWYQFQVWGRDPVLRPLYAVSCSLLGCTLPVMQDLRQMRTRNLIVRSHPDTARALIVDAVIVNEWDYAQPYPELELTFKSLNGELVAGRRFEPSEYLSGDLARGEMPPNTPIRIELEIEDPGPEAVNYFLTFR